MLQNQADPQLEDGTNLERRRVGIPNRAHCMRKGAEVSIRGQAEACPLGVWPRPVGVAGRSARLRALLLELQRSLMTLKPLVSQANDCPHRGPHAAPAQTALQPWPLRSVATFYLQSCWDN